MTTSARSKRKLLDRLLGALIVVMLAVGGWLIYDGFKNPTFEPAPMPKAEFTVDAPTPVPAAGPVHPDGMDSGTIMIPALGIYAPLTDEKSVNGWMTLPGDLAQVGIHAGTAPLASPAGSTVLAGHVNGNGVNGALYRLYETSPGMQAWTKDRDGHLRQWVASSLKAYKKAALPQDIFDVDGPRRLTVVTCGGAVVGWHYTDNVIATFVPVS